MDEEKNETELKRSEEINDIVDKMPVKGVKWVLIVVISLASVMIVFGYIVKYPEIVSGTITLTTSKVPVVLVAKSNGRLQLLNNKTRQKVRRGEVFAVFYNSTDLKELLVVDSLLCELSNYTYPDSSLSFPLKMNLGELNSDYFQFVSNYDELLLLKTANLYVEKMKSLEISVNECDTMLRYSKARLGLKEKQLSFYRKEVSRDSMRFKIGDYIEREFERTQNVYHSAIEDYESLSGNIAAIYLKKETLQNQISQLTIERQQNEMLLKTRYMQAYNNLQSSIARWKEFYAFVAPIDGVVEFLDFWRENDFVASGSEVFSIIPQEGDLIGHMLLPSIGAGKVKKGQHVTIQLDNYPYLEFGSISGTVQSMSLLTNKKQQSGERKELDMYLLTVSLPHGLTTKFGSQLEFSYEIKGLADIQTRKRRLIERLFDNLKYITQE